MIKGGVNLVFHLMPRTIIDPYFGFDLGIQGTLARYRSYDPLTGEQQEGDDDNASFQPGFQLGVDLHPVPALGVGLFAHGAPQFGGEGEPHEPNENQSVACPIGSPGCTPAGDPCSGNSCIAESKIGSHILFGTRVAYTFP